MKLIKILIIALVLTFSMQLAKAQVSVGIGVNIGTPVRRVYVERPYYDAYPRTVYYARPGRYYARLNYYRYRRPVYHHVVYREHFRGHGRGYGHGRHW